MGGRMRGSIYLACLVAVACHPVLGPFVPVGAPQYCAADPDCHPVGRQQYACQFLRSYNPDGSLPRAQCVPVGYDPLDPIERQW